MTSSIPIGVTGRAAAIAPPRPAKTIFVKSIFKWKKTFLYCCAASGKRHGNSNGLLRTISFETATPIPYASGRSPRGGSLPLSIHPLLPPSPPPTPPVSPPPRSNRGDRLSSSNRFPRPAAKPVLFSSGKLGIIHICTAVLQAISGTTIATVTYGRFLSKRLRPCRTHQVESLAEAPSLSPSLPCSLPPSHHPCLPPS